MKVPRSYIAQHLDIYNSSSNEFFFEILQHTAITAQRLIVKDNHCHSRQLFFHGKIISWTTYVM